MATETQAGKPCVDVSRYELSLNGKRVKLERQPMELLILFVQKRGELVTREEIIDKLWGKDVFVDVDRSINSAVRKIRNVLGDDPTQPHYLETVVGKGYRFVGEVEVVGLAGAQESPRRATPASRVGPALLVFVALAIVAAVALWGWLRWRQNAESASAHIHSIVVLPLANLSGDPSQEYFADGMTDELITDLAKVGALRVISRTSSMAYKSSPKPLGQIARELNVDAVVEGSVTRSSQRVRITAQLIDARNDRHLWAENYDRDIGDVVTMQNQIARAIANEVQAKLTPQENVRLSAKQPVDSEAYDDYLQGLFFWHKFSEPALRRALQYFLRSVQKDPSYAKGYAGLANAYHQLAQFDRPKELMAKSLEASGRALQLDESLGDAHAARGWVEWVYEWDWQSAEKEFLRAIQLNPSDAISHGMYANYLDSISRFEEASREHQTARELDPVALILITNVGDQFLFLRQYDRAIEEYRSVLDRDPGFEWAHIGLAQAYQYKGMERESLFELQQAATANGQQELAEVMKVAYAHSGYQGEWRSWLRYRQQQRSKGVYLQFSDDARVYLQLGEKDSALKALEKAFAEREGIVQLNVDPAWDPLRSDPRFQALWRRMTLAQ